MEKNNKKLGRCVTGKSLVKALKEYENNGDPLSYQAVSNMRREHDRKCKKCGDVVKTFLNEI